MCLSGSLFSEPVLPSRTGCDGNKSPDTLGVGTHPCASQHTTLTHLITSLPEARRATVACCILQAIDHAIKRTHTGLSRCLCDHCYDLHCASLERNAGHGQRKEAASHEVARSTWVQTERAQPVVMITRPTLGRSLSPVTSPLLVKSRCVHNAPGCNRPLQPMHSLRSVLGYEALSLSYGCLDW